MQIRKEMNKELAVVEKAWLDQMKNRNLPGEEILEAFKRYLNE